MHLVSEMNLDENIETNPIRSCEHRDALSVFVHQQDIALCTECFFPKYQNLGGATLKMAATNQISQFQDILTKATNSLKEQERL